MIQTVYDQIKKCENDLDIVIATNSKEIYDHGLLFNAKTIMTNKNHISGTDRCNEVVNFLNTDYDLIINVQADEPLINPKQIDKIIDSFKVCPDDIISLAKDNIKNIQVYVGEFDELITKEGLTDIHFKEHPLNKEYKGIEDPRDWMFDVKGYYPSFFAFWKKCKKQFSY